MILKIEFNWNRNLYQVTDYPKRWTKSWQLKCLFYYQVPQKSPRPFSRRRLSTSAVFSCSTAMREVSQDRKSRGTSTAKTLKQQEAWLRTLARTRPTSPSRPGRTLSSRVLPRTELTDVLPESKSVFQVSVLTEGGGRRGGGRRCEVSEWVALSRRTTSHFSFLSRRRQHIPRSLPETDRGSFRRWTKWSTVREIRRTWKPSVRCGKSFIMLERPPKWSTMVCRPGYEYSLTCETWFGRFYFIPNNELVREIGDWLPPSPSLALSAHPLPLSVPLLPPSLPPSRPPSALPRQSVNQLVGQSINHTITRPHRRSFANFALWNSWPHLTRAPSGAMTDRMVACDLQWMFKITPSRWRLWCYVFIV